MKGPNSATRRGRVFDRVHAHVAMFRFEQLRASGAPGAIGLQAFAETEWQGRAVYAAVPALERWGLVPMRALPDSPPGQYHDHRLS